MRYHHYPLLFILVFHSFLAFSQKRDPDLVQFSGVVVTADSLQPVAFCDIIIEKAHRGTTSDYSGYFSFVAKKGDVVSFIAMGYQETRFVIPDTITRNRYSLIQVMTSDTIMLSEAVIYPWPTVEQFKEAFISLHVPDDDLEIARKNLEGNSIQERAMSLPMDGSMNYRNLIEHQTAKMYYVGQLPPMNIFNPFAWAQFLKAWREGKFKKKKN